MVNSLLKIKKIIRDYLEHLKIIKYNFLNFIFLNIITTEF